MRVFHGITNQNGYRKNVNMKIRFFIGMLMTIPTYTVIFKFIPAETISVHPWQLVGLVIQMFGMGLMIGSGFVDI